MIEDDAIHRGRIAACLDALGRDGVVQRFQVLQGGMSEASTYRVWSAGEQAVLKIVMGDSAFSVLERARREVLFYRHLGPRVPLRLPDVLGAAVDESTVYLCLRAYDPAPPIETWQERHYVQIAEQLGRFHAIFWGASQPLAELGWLRKGEYPSDPSTLRTAVGFWRELAQQPEYADILRSEVIAWIEGLIARMDRVGRILRAFPRTLCHGDCHHGNVLLDDSGHWVWADWQEISIGPGPGDLSFFLQRARMAGGTVGDEAVLEAYCRSVNEALAEAIEPAQVRTVMYAAELQAVLLLWPPYLSGVPGEWVELLVRHLKVVAETVFP